MEIQSLGVSTLLGSTTARNQQMTEEQRTAMNEILAQYDAEDFSDEDFQSMQEQLREAGIRPSEELREALESSGFEIPEPSEGTAAAAGAPIGGPGGVGGPGGPPPPPSSSEEEEEDDTTAWYEANSTVSSAISELVEKYQNLTLTDEDIASFVETVEEAGVNPTGMVVNRYA